MAGDADLPAWARQDMPDGKQQEEFDGLVRGMLGQAAAAGLPVTGTTALLAERIARLTCRVRQAEAVQDLEPGDVRGLLADECGLADKTRRAHLDSARRFLAAAVPDSESGPLLSALTASDVTAFLVGMTRIQAPDTTQNTASMLRTFLTWLYAEGLTSEERCLADHGRAT